MSGKSEQERLAAEAEARAAERDKGIVSYHYYLQEDQRADYLDTVLSARVALRA
jgi:hypothetical protein